MKPRNRRLSKHDAPDPARTYERAKPEAEAGMGRLDADKIRDARQADSAHHAVSNQQPLRQINADDVINAAHGQLPTEDLTKPSPGHRPPPEKPAAEKS